MTDDVAAGDGVPGQAQQRAELRRRFLLAAFADPDAFAAIPWDVELFLLPDDDPAFAAAEIDAAARAAQGGADVYLRHVRVRDLPDRTTGPGRGGGRGRG